MSHSASRPISKTTLHVTNISSMDKASLKLLFEAMPGFRRIAFHSDYLFVCFSDLDEASAAINTIQTKTNMQATYAKSGITGHSPPSISVPPSSILCRFFSNHALVRFKSVQHASNALERLNADTNLFANFSTKGSRGSGNASISASSSGSSGNSHDHVSMGSSNSSTKNQSGLPSLPPATTDSDVSASTEPLPPSRTLNRVGSVSSVQSEFSDTSGRYTSVALKGEGLSGSQSPSTTNTSGSRESYQAATTSSRNTNSNGNSSVSTNSGSVSSQRVPKCTIHITQIDKSMAALYTFLSLFEGFSMVAFYPDYCFVRFHDIQSASHAIEEVLFKTHMKASFARADYTLNSIPAASIGVVNSIVRVADFPSTSADEDLRQFFSLMGGFKDIHFYQASCLIYFTDHANATAALQEINTKTNFTAIYSKKTGPVFSRTSSDLNITNRSPTMRSFGRGSPMVDITAKDDIDDESNGIPNGETMAIANDEDLATSTTTTSSSTPTVAAATFTTLLIDTSVSPVPTLQASSTSASGDSISPSPSASQLTHAAQLPATYTTWGGLAAPMPLDISIKEPSSSVWQSGSSTSDPLQSQCVYGGDTGLGSDNPTIHATTNGKAALYSNMQGLSESVPTTPALTQSSLLMTGMNQDIARTVFIQQEQAIAHISSRSSAAAVTSARRKNFIADDGDEIVEPIRPRSTVMVGDSPSLSMWYRPPRNNLEEPSIRPQPKSLVPVHSDAHAAATTTIDGDSSSMMGALPTQMYTQPQNQGSIPYHEREQQRQQQPLLSRSNVNHKSSISSDSGGRGASQATLQIPPQATSLHLTPQATSLHLTSQATLQPASHTATPPLLLLRPTRTLNSTHQPSTGFSSHSSRVQSPVANPSRGYDQSHAHKLQTTQQQQQQQQQQHYPLHQHSNSLNNSYFSIPGPTQVPPRMPFGQNGLHAENIGEPHLLQAGSHSTANTHNLSTISPSSRANLVHNPLSTLYRPPLQLNGVAPFSTMTALHTQVTAAKHVLDVMYAQIVQRSGGGGGGVGLASDAAFTTYTHPGAGLTTSEPVEFGTGRNAVGGGDGIRSKGLDGSDPDGSDGDSGSSTDKVFLLSEVQRLKLENMRLRDELACRRADTEQYGMLQGLFSV
ncbi:hypothetical protein BASA81_008951 [Batrachochytrium salamandrivorans]|nr:hypothetical protein BASA81_008951 [Batrachochytrium salamandrivorans]